MRVAVVGGGISGLACAHRLLELGKQHAKDFDLVLLEAGPRTGGILETEKRDGFLLEKGPDAFIREKPWALDLAKRLGLENEVLGTKKPHRRSFIVCRGKLYPVPEGFYLIGPSRILPFLSSPLFSIAGKVRILSEVLVPKKNDDADESLGSFVRRRFGKECLERAGQALLGGIYTGDPEALGLSATMPRFRELEKKYGSVSRGLRAEMGLQTGGFEEAGGPRYGLFVSFKDGMQTLTDALAKKIPSVSVRLNSSVKKISRDPVKNIWVIETAQGPAIEADRVCVALPARRSAVLLKESDPVLSEKLSELRYESVASVNMAFRGLEKTKIPEGFGFVVPRTEKRTVLACTFADRKFEGRAPEGGRLFRVFAGGAFGREVLEKSDAELLEGVRGDLRELLGIREDPIFSQLQRHPSAMIQYGVGHLHWIAEVRTLVKNNPGLHLAGASFGGVGIPDCVREAEEQAEKIFQTIQEKEKRSVC